MMRMLAMSAAIILMSAFAHAQQPIAPREYPFGKEPYYYYSDDMPWYDSYGRLRYGPLGIPDKEYRRMKRMRWEDKFNEPLSR
jgi:hypothetical protein